MVGKYRLSTLGCKVNQYESQQIRELVESLGLTPAGPGEIPDIAIVNTCAVTARAIRKSRQTVRRLARNHTAVVVVGCGVSADELPFRQIDGVVAALGHDANLSLELSSLITSRQNQPPPELIRGTDKPGTPPCVRPRAERDEVSMSPSLDPKIRPAASGTAKSDPYILSSFQRHVKLEGHFTDRISAFVGHVRAFLKVQDGCDAGCTYCIIPRLRPNLIWKPIAVAVAEARDLVNAGHREIVVTGVFLGAYGRNTAIPGRRVPAEATLAELIAALAVVPGLERIRLSSLEPGDVDESLLHVLTRHANCVPHLHLPLQSGSPEILKRMNRRYTREEYVETIARVRSVFDHPAITTDILVGFPGETAEDFAATLEVARQTKFAKIHAFPFSPRAGTAAARWSARFVPPTVTRERMRQLAEVERQSALAFRSDTIGTIERVLIEANSGVEEQHSKPGKTCRGRADRYFEVYFEAPANARPGDLVLVRIDRVTATQAFGTYIRDFEPHQTRS